MTKDLKHLMFPAVHTALTRLLYNEGKIDRRAVRIAFDTPSTRFFTALTGPTLLFCLYEISENKEVTAPKFGMEADKLRPEMQRWRVNSRRFNLRYLVGAIAADAHDERLLLGQTLAALCRYPKLSSAGVLAPSKKDSQTVSEAAAPTLLGFLESPKDAPRALDIWSAFGAEPRPGFLYTVIAPLDLEEALLPNVSYDEWEEWQAEFALPETEDKKKEIAALSAQEKAARDEREKALRDKVERMTPWEQEQFTASWFRPVLHTDLRIDSNANTNPANPQENAEAKTEGDEALSLPNPRRRPANPALASRMRVAGIYLSSENKPLADWQVKLVACEGRTVLQNAVTDKNGRFYFRVLAVNGRNKTPISLTLHFFAPNADANKPPLVFRVALRHDHFVVFRFKMPDAPVPKTAPKTVQRTTRKN